MACVTLPSLMLSSAISVAAIATSAAMIELRRESRPASMAPPTASSSSPMACSLVDEPLYFRRVVGQPRHPFEPEPELFQKTDRRAVRRAHNREQPAHAEIRADVVSHGARRFECVPLPPVPGQKRKAEIRIRQRVALEEAADADRFARAVQFDQMQTEPVQIGRAHV